MRKSQLIFIGLASAISLGGGVGFVAAKMAKSPMNQPTVNAPSSPAVSVQPNETPKPVTLSQPVTSPKPLETATPKPVETETPKPQPVVPPESEQSAPTDKAPTDKAPTDESLTDESLTDEAVIQAVVDRQDQNQLCDFDFDRDVALRASEVFAKQDGVYLVRLACRMAAYQGVSAMVRVDATEPEWKIESLNQEFAGFPHFDAETQVISNTYKYNGVGTCVEHSKYHWNGYGLTLVSSEVEDGRPDGCEDWGARSPESRFLITESRVGAAELGMTLGELKQKLDANTTYEQVALGVDMGYGMEVKQYGAVQFHVGFEDPRPLSEQDPNSPFEITDNAIVSLVVVRNPNYRTQENIGPGTHLKKAEAQYGPASLAYSYENEGREYVQFQRQQELIMRTNQGTLTAFAGVYPKDSYEVAYQQTDRYHDHAAIGSIMIVKR